MKPDPDIDKALAALDPLAPLAARLADAALAETLPRFRMAGLGADNKAGAGAFDPVTEADRAAERAMRRILAAERPDDAIHGEEEEARGGSSGLAWVIDPVDGTRAFISGLPLWGTLIALDDGERGRLGLIDLPATGDRLAGAPGRGALAIGGAGARPISVRATTSLAEATLMTTDPELFDATGRAGFERVRRACRMARLGTDCTGYAMVAMGFADLVIETGLKAVDIAAPKAVIEAAGGIVTDWQGGDCRWGGPAIAAATPALHAAALELLS